MTRRPRLGRVLPLVVAGAAVVTLWSGSPSPSPTDDSLPGLTGPWVDPPLVAVDDTLPDVVMTRLADVQLWVEEERGLRFLEPVVVEPVSADEWTAITGQWHAERRDILPDTGLILAHFGVLHPPQEFGLVSSSYLDGVVHLFADGEDIGGGSPLLGPLADALTDQHFGHERRRDGLLQEGLFGEHIDGLRLLVEGDRNFMFEGYSIHVMVGWDWRPEDYPCQEPTGFNWYTVARAYVCDLHAEGGWDRVNAEYASPPASTAEVMGLACDSAQSTPTTVDGEWATVFEAPRGPLWFGGLSELRAIDFEDGVEVNPIEGLSSWCADTQRLYEAPDGVQVMVMDIWVDTEADAHRVATSASTVFANADNQIGYLISRRGTWVGIASTLDDIDLCDLLPDWCAS